MKSFPTRAVSTVLGALSLALLPGLACLAQDKPNSVTNKTQSDWDKYRATADRHATIGDAVAHKALSFRGVPYRFGGTTSKGIDCSGFAQAIYSKWGMMLPRTSIEQFKKGKPVHGGELKPGDLIFFKNTYRQGISHVGIYIGDGKFVHAANERKGVIVTKLAEPYYLHRLAGARRIALDEQVAKKEDDVASL